MCNRLWFVFVHLQQLVFLRLILAYALLQRSSGNVLIVLAATFRARSCQCSVGACICRKCALLHVTRPFSILFLYCASKVTSNGRRGHCQIYRQLRKNFPPKADKRCSSTTFKMTNLSFREASKKECSLHILLQRPFRCDPFFEIRKGSFQSATWNVECFSVASHGSVAGDLEEECRALIQLYELVEWYAR
jgi:hypothetical protein